MLTELLFTITWWLRKPMLWLVRYRIAPDEVAARLNLDPNRPVCFVLPERSSKQTTKLEPMPWSGRV